MNTYEYLLQDINSINGIGNKTSKLFKKKNINTIFDLLWSLPRDTIDRSNLVKINELQIGKIQTITVNIKKYNFPRIRNLPNKVYCEDETGTIDCIFFNSYEGYIRKILPLGKQITLSGKVSFFRNKYQITNPKYVAENEHLIKKKHSNYSLTDGISEKVYNNIFQKIIKNLPDLNEWHNKNILQCMCFYQAQEINQTFDLVYDKHNQAVLTYLYLYFYLFF